MKNLSLTLVVLLSIGSSAFAQDKTPEALSLLSTRLSRVEKTVSEHNGMLDAHTAKFKSIDTKLASNPATVPPVSTNADEALYDRYVASCKGFKNIDSSKKEDDIKSFKTIPDNDFADMLKKCEEGRTAAASQQQAEKILPGLNQVGPEALPAIGRLRYARVLRDCAGVWIPEAGKERENIIGFNKMPGDEFNKFTTDCLSKRNVWAADSRPDTRSNAEPQQGQAETQRSGGGNPYAGRYDYSQVFTVKVARSK